MVIEAVFIKPIVDAVLASLKKIYGVKVKKDAATELGEVIRNLLQLSPDMKAAEVKILAAKAAGVYSKEILLVEEMFIKHRASAKPLAKKAVAKKAVAKKPAAKKVAARKPATRKAVA